jgi:hypothetical protein
VAPAREHVPTPQGQTKLNNLVLGELKLITLFFLLNSIRVAANLRRTGMEISILGQLPLLCHAILMDAAGL